jgi:hypothetical protein
MTLRRFKRLAYRFFFVNDAGVRDLRRIKPQFRHLYRDEMTRGDTAGAIVCLIKAANRGHRNDYQHYQHQTHGSKPLSAYLSEVQLLQPRDICAEGMD